MDILFPGFLKYRELGFVCEMFSLKKKLKKNDPE